MSGGMTFREQVAVAKRDIIRRAVTDASGSRTRAAKTLGLQRTYMLRLIRTLAVPVPPPMARKRKAAA
jgi:DNA-binding NtrC family response regulator